MPPYTSTTTITRLEEAPEIKSCPLKTEKKLPELKAYNGIFGHFKTDLIWLHILSIGLFHVLTVIGFFIFIITPTINIQWKTVVWAFAMGGIAGFGVTAGAHRLWCHRSYKAKLPLQILLIICYSCAGQNRIYDWVRDHRVHHKYSETSADPHDSNRGFFFAHIGWLFMRKHPEVIRRGREIDMSDITNDPLIQFHQKYFHVFRMIFAIILPSLIPIYFWDECYYSAIYSQVFCRYLFSLHFTWSVNSAAHLYGNKPYDAKINPRENLAVSMIAMGEGWHNYHHTFPWDYKASEIGKINVTLFWLNLFAKIGWAYDLKSPSDELVKMVIERRGEKAFHNGMDAEIPESEELLLKKSF